MVSQWLLLLLWGFSAAYAQNICFDSVRLVQTQSIAQTDAGRVEVCRNGVWGTVCADSPTTPWSEKNAQVVCRQLGYSGALNSILQDLVPSSERPNSSTPIHYRSVRCSGGEDRLTDCPGISTATASCSHAQDAYIACRPSSQGGRSTGGPSPGAIIGIVFAIAVVLFIIVPFVYGVGKDKWSRRNASSWYQTMTRWFNRSQDTPTTTVAMETAATGINTTRAHRWASTSSNNETEQPPQRPDTELTSAAPPSYHASSNYPTGDPLKAPPTDLPPPYPGPPTGNPPAGLGFSLVTPNYQGTPPAYHGRGLPYSTTAPYPVDTSSHTMHTSSHTIELPSSPSAMDDNCSGGSGGGD